MVGLSVILENYRGLSAKKTPRVISKGSMIKPPFSNSFSPTSSPPLSPGFLDCCFLCKQKLLPGKDIYMYKGDRAFCSEECRCRQIFMDEEESSSSTIAKKSCTSSSEYNCSLAAIKVVPPPPPYTTSSPSSSRSGKGPRNRPNAFAC